MVAKRILWIDLQNLQPAELTESTESTESREAPGQLQAEVDRYAKWIVDLILGDPYISVPEIARQLKDGGGLCSREGSAIHLFGGPRIFRKTCHRMEALRWARVKMALTNGSNCRSRWISNIVNGMVSASTSENMIPMMVGYRGGRQICSP